MTAPSKRPAPRARGADSPGDGAGAPKRRHRATGKPRGGKRSGAGRPQGSKDVLPRGAVAAIKAAGLRVPDGATPAQRQLADRALVRIADVMEERVNPFASFAVLTSARSLREEVCGKVTQPVQHDVGPKLSELLAAALQLPSDSPPALGGEGES